MAADCAPSFFQIAMDRSVRGRAFRIAAVVGTVLALINHGDRLLAMDLDGEAILKICLTFLVPYCVSTYSSVLAVRERMQSLS
ncbi:MAG: nitrate/nitrite transporter NrtS [Pseudomonadota bacterium]